MIWSCINSSFAKCFTIYHVAAYYITGMLLIFRSLLYIMVPFTQTHAYIVG